MKNKLIGKMAVLILALTGALSIGVFAQTADDGPGPSEQPSAPMEVGQGQQPDQSMGPNQPSYDESNSQPTEAQQGGPTGEAPAQTDQGVARLSLIHGDVSTQRGDSGDWSAAALNAPVMGGDKVSTGDSARTELQLDFANVMRLGPNTKVNIANLTHRNIQLQLSEGIANYTVSKDSEAEPEIDTPNVSIHPSHHDGVFRVEVRPDGDTIVIVRQGEAQIATPEGSTEVHAGDMATVRGDANSAQYKISAAPDRDDWDRWNSDRDHLIRDASSWRHTNRRYTGTQDLDAYGRWQNVPDYGDVWVPNEPEDWAPYRDGSWTYEPYYGWTWVGYEPWGWAPYHYGRWFWYGNSWAWWPGPVWAGYNPFWSPAYVSFWGWGGGFGFGVGFGWGGWGGFGWLPLGPCDWFHPWWGGYRGRFGWTGGWGGYRGWAGRYGGFAPLHNGLRFSNIANMHDVHVSRGLSTVGAGRFGAGRVSAMAATREQIGGARMMAGNLPVVPSRASLSASGRAAAASTMRNGGSQRFFGAHNNISRPVSFQQQTASLRQTMQQNHVSGIPAGGRSSAEFAARSQNNMQRPSAGVAGNRESSSFGNRGAGNQSSFANSNRGGFNAPNNANRPSGAVNERGTVSRPNQGADRPFNAPTNNNRGGFNAPNNANRPNGAVNERGTVSRPNQGADRPFNAPTNNNRSFGNESVRGSQPNSGGFRPFTPPSNSQAGRGGSAPYTRGSSSPYSRGGSSPYSQSGGGYWNRTAPSTAPRSGGYSDGYGRGASGARPQLDTRQPIVRGPSYGGYSRGGAYGNYGGSRAPSYGGSRAPAYGGSRAPAYSGGGRSYGGYSGGGHAPSGGGGGHYSGGGGGGHPSGGGGGGHASGGGGGHSGGGHR